MCNALIEGRNGPRAMRPVTDLVGNWIRGTVALRGDHLHFSTNRLNAIMQDGTPLVLPYSDILSCKLDRLAFFLKTVDIETSRFGLVRFRCLLAWNETLLSELKKRLPTG
jgi:hypothetical protein